MTAVAVAQRRDATPGLRRRWECADCRVTVRNASGEPIPEPAGWVDGLCIPCQRESLMRGDGKATLIERELRRGRPVKEVAHLARVTQREVKAVRDDLAGRAAGLDRPRRGGRGVPVNRDREIAQLYESQPGLTTREISERVGISGKSVRKARQRLGLPRPPSRRKREAAGD